MAILYKDFTTFRRINSIHIERLEDLKTFFDEIGVIYSEGQATLNWSNVLTEIRDNFEDWLDDGGWNFLIEDVSKFFRANISID
jgi:nucleosome binding factor SPN SPT16 subunit